MVQVLPYIQSPLEQLQPYIQNFAQTIGHGLRQRGINRQNEGAMAAFQTAQTPMEQISAFSKFHPDTQKNLSPLVTQLIKNSQSKKEEQMISDEAIDSSLNTIENLLDTSSSVGLSANPMDYFSDQALEDKGQWDTAKLNLIAALRDKVNKGVLTNQKFKFIIDSMPDFHSRKATSSGKLKELRKQLLPSEQSEGKMRKAENKSIPEFKIGQTFDKMPRAEDVPAGSVINDGNKRYRSNGTIWQEI